MRARSRRVFLGSPRLQPWVAHTASIRPCVLSSSHGLPHDVPYWLPALCVMCRPRLACLSLSHPFRSSVSSLAPSCVSSLALPACLISPPRPIMLIRRACPSRLIRSSCLLSLRPLDSLCLFAPFLVSPGGASLVSPSSRHASRLPSLRFACPLLGVLTVILNAVAMGTVGCGAFVPRFHKLHLLSMGVVRISSSARRPFFSTFLPPRSSCR